MVETHINAYYRDLADAKRSMAEAQGRVDELERQIVARGAELPEEGSELPPEPTSEDTVTADDVSATEVKAKRDSKGHFIKKGKS